MYFSITCFNSHQDLSLVLYNLRVGRDSDSILFHEGGLLEFISHLKKIRKSFLPSPSTVQTAFRNTPKRQLVIEMGKKTGKLKTIGKLPFKMLNRALEAVIGPVVKFSFTLES